MTLIVSMRRKYGAMILADSQETAKDRDGNEFKYAVLKNSPERLKGFHFVIAGGGDGEAIDELTENFRRELRKSNCRTLDCFRSLFEKHLRRELKLLQGGRIEVIIAATKSKKWEVWRNARGTLVPTVSALPTLVGFETELYKHVGATLSVRAQNQVELILVGLRILELARQTSTCVDAPHHGVFIVPVGMFVIDDKVLSELTASIGTFGAFLDDILLASSDTSLSRKDFTRKLDEFKETALHLRDDYLQTVNREDSLAELRGTPSGIRFFPNKSVRSTSLGSGGVAVKVDEYD